MGQVKRQLFARLGVNDPILKAELKKRSFPKPIISAVLLMILWALSAWVLGLVEGKPIDPNTRRGLFGVYLLWLSMPLICASLIATWMREERRSESFQMLRQTGLSDQQISRGYFLASVYRLRLLLIVINGLFPLLLLGPRSDGSGLPLFRCRPEAVILGSPRHCC